tara:strand:+ start:497 stop:1360 length:864 start_codon:yes stop_codon:yes gene_type:complete
MNHIKLLLLSYVFLTISCENQESTIPSFIEINSYDIENNNPSSIPHSKNYLSHNITDCWVTIDGQFVGTFEIPSTIPILIENVHTIELSPGIKVNGISSSRIKYPFYEKFQITSELIKNNTIEINPTTNYKEDIDVIFETSGSFEQTGTMFENGEISDTSVVRQSFEVFQGQFSGAVFLDSTNSRFDIRNINQLDIPLNTFMELDFKSNISFNVGVIILNSGNLEIKEELIQLYPTNEWKKIYLDLYPLLSKGNIYSTFKIYIDGQFDDSVENNAIFFDNLKLIQGE